MSTAIVYYSMLGNSEMIANKMALKLGADVIRIEPDKAYPDIGFPVWASRPAPPICTFINDQKDKMSGKKIFVFACQSGNGAEKAFDRIKKMIGIEKFTGEMIFIDPKTRVNADNDRKIDLFCKIAHHETSRME